ncbi:MAG: hypothetical protein PHZ00_02030 [Candidatus Peribacteraceae bacterium]|nr:hypothetical protein [Candidatus Peribacteraceae bacterium]
MQSTLVLLKDDQPRQLGESELQYQDRMDIVALHKLREKKKRSKEEDAEHETLTQKVSVAIMHKNGDLSTHFADKDLKVFANRVRAELANQYGDETPIKRILLDRITSAWSMAFSYERTFHLGKYKLSEDGTYSWNRSHENTAYLKEARRGIESMNDQILRLTQALQNLVQPPIQVKATNAFFAQNQQVNQGQAPRVAESIPVPNRNEKATP